MSQYHIITDSGCDLNQAMIDQLNITVVPLIVNFRGQSLEDSVDAGIADMYAGLRSGEPATTSAINPDRWTKAMEPALSRGEDVLVITFSSGLSTTYQSAVIAANELQGNYPQRKIRVVESLCASLGQGLLVWYACQKRDGGLSIEELTAWLEENKLHLCHWFTVDDLMYLKRGGRVSAATALVGTMLNIKPVLQIQGGRLDVHSKVRGMKAAKKAMLDAAETDINVRFAGRPCTIRGAYSCSAEEAAQWHDEICARFPGYDVRLDPLTLSIACHIGPGAVAITVTPYLPETGELSDNALAPSAN